MRVLHVTAHLGGGVGRVLSQVALERRRAGSAVEDVFLCLETPRTARHVDALRAAGIRLAIAPEGAETAELLAQADIVQLEWWHHPLMAAWLHRHEGMAARLVVWSHTSGLHYPAIPDTLVALPHAFLATSAQTLRLVPRTSGNLIETVPSAAGFDGLPEVVRHDERQVSFGYLGSLNPAKLHPDILAYLAAVALPDFQVQFHGERGVHAALEQAATQGDPRLVLHGHTDSPGAVLQQLDVLVYLLNPTHYGTTENALLEAMACGVVPVVLDNPVETAIVRQGETGLVVTSPQSFAAAIDRLARQPEERRRLAANAAATVRRDYAVARTVERLDAVYHRLLPQDRRCFGFDAVFGTTPAQWFAAGLGDYAWCFGEGATAAQRRALPFLYEASKSSIFQFRQYFPEDAMIARWAAMLEQDLAFFADA